MVHLLWIGAFVALNGSSPLILLFIHVSVRWTSHRLLSILLKLRLVQRVLVLILRYLRNFIVLEALSSASFVALEIAHVVLGWRLGPRALIVDQILPRLTTLGR